MLTADLVDVRRRGTELSLKPFDERTKAEALELARLCLDAARAHVGARREEVEAAWNAASVEARSARLAGAVRKIVEDACVFEAEPTTPPATLRRALFTRASELRTGSEDGHVERDAVVREVATAFAMTPEALERALFGDLRAEHLLRGAPALTEAEVLETYEREQAQAVLLRAVRVTCIIHSFSPSLLRAFFAKLKFNKLLFTAEREADESFRVVIDGPFSMFESVTRYGLRLALLLPALRALDRWSLVADVRWGNAREPCVFRLASPVTKERRAEPPRRGRAPKAEQANDDDETHLADDVRELLVGLRKTATAFDVKVATALLDVPGLGLCIPDLVLRPKAGGEPIYVEIMGFWSRDAVFRRVELARRGMNARVVFAVSARLRVSEALLDASDLSLLYVYRGKMSARALLERVEAVRRGCRPAPRRRT